MHLFRFALFSLAVFRATQLIVNEEGPGEIFWRIRKLCGMEAIREPITGICVGENPTTYLAKFLHCHKCVGVWISATFFLLNSLSPAVASVLFVILAASAIEVMTGAILDHLEI